MRIFLSLLFLLLSGLVPLSAAACSVCYCGDPTLLPVGLAQPEEGRLRLSLDGTFLHKEAGEAPSPAQLPRHAGGGEGFESHDEFRLSMTGAVVLRGYQFSAVVPWVSKELSLQEGAKVTRGQLSGPGDVELYARRMWFLSPRLAPKRHLVGLSAGIKLPTGMSRLLTEEGTLVDPHLQPGSGSLDVLAGVSYLYDADPFSLYASLLGRQNGEGSGGLRYGASLFANVAARYRLGESLLVGLEVNGRVTAYDQEGEERDPDSGGVIVFATPQVAFRPWERFTLRAQVQLPLWEGLFGTQREAPVLQFGTSYDI